MASPTVSARNQTNSGNATSHPAAIPTHATGDLLVIAFAFDGSPTISVNEGVSGSNWTLETPDNHSTGTPTVCIVWKLAESSGDVLTLTTGTSEASANMGWAIDAGSSPDLEFAYNEGSSSNPDPPGLTPSSGSQDYLWLTGFGRDNQATASAGPDGWDEFRTEPGQSSGGASMAVAELSTTGTTVDPGAFTVGVEQWIGFTISVYDAASGAATDLVPQEASQAHAADNITLSTDNSVSLTVQDATHGHAADSVALTTDTTLAVQDATHAHTADNVPSGSLIEITGLDFTYDSAGSGNNYSLKQAAPPSRIHCTLMWYEKRQTQTIYSGGVLFCNDSGDFDGGQDVAMFVTHGCPGTFNATTGQRNSGDTSLMHHEIAGMSSASLSVSGRDYIASRSALVEAGETQQSFDAVYDEWIPRVARITTDGSTVIHENYVDWRDPLLVIRQNLATTDIDDLSGERLWIGAPPWITNGSENFRAKFFFVKQFSRPLSDSEINTEFANFSDTPIADDCWFSNIYPELTAGVMPDLKGFGTAHDFALYDGDTPSSFTEDFEPQFFDASVSLAVDDSAHAHAADNLTVSTGTALVVAEASHAHAADAPTLSAGTSLTVSESTHGHGADSPVLSTDLTLAIADASHAHAAESLTLETTSGTNLTIADAAHAHTADSTSLSTGTSLAVADALQSHAADGLTLTTDQHLTIADALHAHSADNIVLSDVPTLAVADGLHAHAADGLALSTDSWLTVNDATHAHAADGLTLSIEVLLGIADATHAHSADSLDLSGVPTLAIQDAAHGHTADALSLSLDSWLVVADSWHAHLADSMVLAFDDGWPDGPSPPEHTAVVPYFGHVAVVPYRGHRAIVPL